MADGDLYHSDFYAWTQAQGRAIRAVGSGGNAPVDWGNVAEEIETLGRAERRELTSRIGTIIEHLLKLSVSPAEAPRRGWAATVLRTRPEIEDLLDESPSLRPELPALVRQIGPKSAKLVADLLRNEGELTPERRDRLAAIEFTPEQVFGDWLPDDPA
jgi:hypothetical protein